MSPEHSHRWDDGGLGGAFGVIIGVSRCLVCGELSRAEHFDDPADGPRPWPEPDPEPTPDDIRALLFPVGVLMVWALVGWLMWEICPQTGCWVL